MRCGARGYGSKWGDRERESCYPHNISSGAYCKEAMYLSADFNPSLEWNTKILESEPELRLNEAREILSERAVSGKLTR